VGWASCPASNSRDGCSTLFNPHSLDNWQQLEQDLRTQILTQPAALVETTRYGEKYTIRACLQGVNGVGLDILSVWIVTDDEARFVTLVPDKGGNS
jgi:hypothetical protein